MPGLRVRFEWNRQYEKIRQEYSTLTDKMFAVGLSRKEEVRRIYLKWSKDRIEDAYYGENLDYLENLAVIQESISEEIEYFVKIIKKKK